MCFDDVNKNAVKVNVYSDPSYEKWSKCFKTFFGSNDGEERSGYSIATSNNSAQDEFYLHAIKSNQITFRQKSHSFVCVGNGRQQNS